ncbi:MAG: LexA family protein [Candidatus Fimenecus sp.]
MEIYERVKLRRKEIGLSAETVAEKLGVSPATIYRYENNDIKKFPTDILEPLAKVLRTTPAYLLGIESDNLKSPEISTDTVTFPVIGSIAAGYDEIAVEDWSGETVEIPISYLNGRQKDEFFVLSVHGDSMYPLYMDGDKVLVLKQSTLDRSGDIGAILYDGESATLKKVEYVTGEDWMRLVPINPEFKPHEIHGADLEECRVLGVPRLLIREIV